MPALPLLELGLLLLALAALGGLLLALRRWRDRREARRRIDRVEQALRGR